MSARRPLHRRLPTGAHSTGAHSTGAQPTGAHSIGAQTIGAQTIGAQSIGAQTIGAQSIGGHRQCSSLWARRRRSRGIARAVIHRPASSGIRFRHPIPADFFSRIRAASPGRRWSCQLRTSRIGMARYDVGSSPGAPGDPGISLYPRPGPPAGV